MVKENMEKWPIPPRLISTEKMESIGLVPRATLEIMRDYFHEAND
jgi:hypothetical protein